MNDFAIFCIAAPLGIVMGVAFMAGIAACMRSSQISRMEERNAGRCSRIEEGR